MEIKYTIIYQEHVVKNHITTLPKKEKQLIKNAIEQKLMVDPLYFGKPLRYSLKGHRRLRVLNYRIVYRIENYTVIITAIKHRKDIYKF